MPDFNPYNLPQDSLTQRMRALGVLPTYQPAEPRLPVTPDDATGGQTASSAPSGWSWDYYKQARGFDGKDFEYRRDVWSDYMNKVLPELARYTGDNPATLQSYFQQQFSKDRPVAPTRTMLQAAADTGMTAAKGVISTAKSLSDLISPTSAASAYFGQGLRDIDRAYSPVVSDEMQRRARLIADDQAQGGSGIGPTLQYMWRNPLQAGAEAVGAIAPYLVPGGAVRLGALAPRAAALVNLALGGASGAGMVRGNVWDQISAIPDAELMTRSPEYASLRRTMGEDDAKRAIGASFTRNLPEMLASGALGAAGGVLGAEGALAGLPSRFGRTGTALAEAASQAVQGGATQFATNYGLQRALPQQSLTDNVGVAAVQGGVLGALTGAAVGGMRRPETAPAETPTIEPPRLLPAPVDRDATQDIPTSGPASPDSSAPNFRMRAGADAAIADDIQAVLATLPKVYNREYVARHLDSDVRNGTLADTAQQQNSLGRAAQALMQRMQARAERAARPPELPAPADLPALPSPDTPLPDRAMTVDATGTARPTTYADAAAARAAQAESEALGMTPDVRAVQQRASTPENPRPPAVEPDRARVPEPESEPVEPESPLAPVSSEPIVLQNRDRSTAAAIQQMSRIAADPDPLRLSISRDFANGAPVVEANPTLRLPAAQLGREDVSVAADGRRIPIQYAVVDADTLLPSNTADGTPNADYARGRADRLRAIAGNGRVAGLQAAYDRGTAAAYREGIARDAAQTGIAADVVRRMDRPVLIRVMPREHVTADIGDVSNTTGTAALSPVEQAANDAHRVDLESLAFNDSGEPTPDAVRAFVRSMPVAEQANLLNPDGSPTRQALDRLMAATFQKAYGDPELVRLYAQATDPEARTVLGGMAHAASAMARLDGAGDLDVRSLVTEAASLAVNARRRGVPLADLARQGDLAVAPDAGVFVRVLVDNIRSEKRIGDVLKRVADFAYREATKPDVDMFGTVERASRARILEEANDTGRSQDLAVAGRREPAGTTGVGRAADARTGANGRATETLGSARSRETAGHDDADKRARDEPGTLNAEEPHDPYTPDLFGAGGAHIDRLSAGPLFDVHTESAVQSAPAGDGKFAVSVGSRRAGRLYSGVERVTTPAEVAHAIAGLRRYPQENLVVLVTAADGKPLELLRHQVGDIAQVSANPALLVGSAVRVPNGAHAWILHNHPSGRSKLSGPDMNLSRKIGDLFRGTRLDYRGLFAIGRRDFSFVDPSGQEQTDRLVPTVRRHAIPVTERIFKRVGTFGDPLSDFNAASALTAELSGRRPGVVLLNAQNEPVAFVPMTLERMARLRDTGGADTVFASFDRANARGALVQVESRTGMSLAAVENLARLGRQASVPVIDAFDRQGQSFLRQNLLNVNTGDTYFSRSRRPPPDKPSTTNNTEAPPREGLSVSGRPETYRSLDAWREAWASRGVDLWASESRDGTIRLSKIVVPGNERSTGVGTRMMQELTQYADARRARIALSPSADFGGSSVSRLKAFYKRFGFVENTGRNRDFTVSESMIREPNTVLDAESARDRAVASDAFKRWFGSSRAVDDDGKPLVFYRGSRNAGAEPYNDRAMIFLTRDPAFASNYARDGAVFPVYAKVERPFDASRGEGLRLWREFVQDTNAPSYATARSDRGALPFWTMEPELRRWLDAKHVDYDGIYFAENDGKSSLAVRSMRQIKSAIGNRGTFDPTSPDIAMSRTSGPRGGLDAPAVRRAIADDTFSHHVNVYETLADAPESIRAQADREGGTDVEGFFDPQTNRVALIAENIASPARAREVARHELIGHYGLENMVGADVMRELASKVATAERLGNKAFRAIGQDVDRVQPGLTPARRAREIIALMAERNIQNSIVRRVLDAVRQFLKRVGLLRRDVTDAEIAGLLRDTQRYLRESGRSIASGEREAAAPAADPHWQALPVRERARLQAMYREAESQKPAFDRALESIAQTVGGRAMLAALKSPARAIDKIVNDYKGDAGRIKDLLRGTIVAPDVAAARNAIAAIEQRFETVGQSRNLFADDSEPPADGYRDAKFNVKLGTHVAEIQVNVPAMIEAKKRAHALYVDRSRLERDMDANGETPEKKARWIALGEQMRSIYDDAWARALRTSSTNAAGETGRPLRRAESGSNRRGGSSSHAAENRPANGSPSDTGMSSTSKNSASRDSADAAGNDRSDIADTSDISIPERGSPDASFSRAGSASRTAIPLVEKEPTLTERLKALRANPRAPVDATRRFMTSGGKAPQPKGLEDLITNLFDHRNPLVQLVRRSGNTAAGQRFVHTMRTFEAKTQKTIHDFERDQVDPLMRDLADAWNTTFKKLPWYKTHGYQQFLEDVGTMGNLVKHGPERNAAIAERTQGADMAGSGRTDREIAEIRRELAREAPGLEAFYEQMYARHFRPMLDYRDTVLRDAGLLTPEMEAARPAYDWYVPLTGDPNETEDALSRTAATSLKSPRPKDATGREGTLSQNVLHNVLERTEVAIRQAGMQDFKRDFVKLIEQSPAAKGLASARVNSATSNEIFEKYVGDDGFIHRRVKGNAGMSPDALVLHDGNSTTVVDVGNRKIFEALNGANKATIDGIFALPDKATRLLGAIYTRYNPVFPLMNKIRDTQSQLSFVLADAPVANKAAAARRAVANNLAFSTQWRDRPGSEFHTWREKYEKLGGSTLYSDLFRDDTMRNIEREFATLAGATPLHRAKAAVEKVGDFIDRVNEHMEMTSRVALFKALADSGMSERDAALYVKNTMNFETRGKYGRQLGALFTFAGPALFDARRMAQSLRSPRGAVVLAAQFALMYGLYGALKAMGGQDDDGISRLDKVPLSQSGRFLTLLDPNDPDGKGWKFPVGFGYGRIALTLAAALHRYADGVDDGATFASNVGKEALLSNFSPMEPVDIDPTKDVSAWAMQQFTPTLMKPLLQLATNQNAQGSPIHKPDEWTGSKLHFGEGWPGTSMLFKSAAKSLYDATGIDVYPETLQLLLRSYGGSGVMEAVRAIQLMGEKADTDWSLADIPGAQAFGSRVINRDAVDFRQNYDALQKRVAERKYAQENGTVEQFDAEHPDVAQALAVYQEANREIKALFQARKEAQQDEDTSRRQQQVQDLNRRIRAIQMQANRAARDVSSAATSQ